MNLKLVCRHCGRELDLMSVVIFDGVTAFCSIDCLREAAYPRLAPEEGQLAPDGDGTVL